MPRTHGFRWDGSAEDAALRDARAQFDDDTGPIVAAVRAAYPRLRRSQVEMRLFRLRTSDPVVTIASSEGPPADDAITDDASADTRTLESPRSARVTTLDALLGMAQVDATIWEVDRYVVNKWEVGAKTAEGVAVEPLFQVKAWLRRIKGASTLALLRSALLSDIRAERTPATRARMPRSLAPDRLFMSVISLFDAHFGKLSWREETGVDYDLSIASARFAAAVEDLLAYTAGFPVGRILFPIGNDLLQTDNLAGTTTAGTQVDSDSRYVKAFRTARSAVAQAIARMASVAPVTVIVVPGNHDRQTAFHLGEVIAAQFSGAPNVTVRNDARLRKYERFGTTLLGFTHGSEEKHSDLPLIMAQEEPDLWGQTTHREWLTGHLHKKKETRFTAGDSFNGVRVRILPALCAADAWHTQHGYVGEHAAAEAFLYHLTRGYAGHFSAAVGAAADADLLPRAA